MSQIRKTNSKSASRDACAHGRSTRMHINEIKAVMNPDNPGEVTDDEVFETLSQMSKSDPIWRLMYSDAWRTRDRSVYRGTRARCGVWVKGRGPCQRFTAKYGFRNYHPNRCKLHLDRANEPTYPIPDPMAGKRRDFKPKAD